MRTPSHVVQFFKNMKTKAIGYVRVSTDKQAEHGVSLEAQVEKIKAMATVHDVELLDVLVDAGESAKDLDRPGMVRILEMVQSRAVGMVIVAKLDRLTETMMFRTSLPEALPVSSDSATDTSETPRRWNCSNRTAKSFTDRVSRSSLATITIPTARDWTISRIRTIPGRSRSLALSPASTQTSNSSTSWPVAIARIFLN